MSPAQHWKDNSGAWWVGIDPASRRTGLAAIDESGRVLGIVLASSGRDLPHRLSSLRRKLGASMRIVENAGIWCACLEQPTTRHGGAALLGAAGVCMEVAASTTEAPVLTLTPAEIDRAVFGDGMRSAGRKVRSMEYARSLGWNGESQDVADAIVAAAAGRALTLRALERERSRHER